MIQAAQKWDRIQKEVIRAVYRAQSVTDPATDRSLCRRLMEGQGDLGSRLIQGLVALGDQNVIESFLSNEVCCMAVSVTESVTESVDVLDPVASPRSCRKSRCRCYCQVRSGQYEGDTRPS